MNNVLELAQVLRGGRQIDEDGTEIGMSRQACWEAAEAVEELVALKEAIAKQGEQDPVMELWEKTYGKKPEQGEPVAVIIEMNTATAEIRWLPYTGAPRVTVGTKLYIATPEDQKVTVDTEGGCALVQIAGCHTKQSQDTQRSN